MTDTISITVDDLSMVVQVIDTCSSRGSFNGDELERVGNLRRKLVTYIQSYEADEASGDFDQQQDIEESQRHLHGG